jgi:hypothetical protein
LETEKSVKNKKMMNEVMMMSLYFIGYFLNVLDFVHNLGVLKIELETYPNQIGIEYNFLLI